ncbi:ribonuclease H-like domain-containing protein [Tanacetum coccineum]
MATCNPTRTPVDTESKIGSDGDLVSDPTLYRSLAGGLQYLTFTRPNISYAIQHVCLHMHDPREPYFSALKRVLCYLLHELDGLGKCIDERVIQYRELQMKERKVKEIQKIKKKLNERKMQTQENLVTEGTSLDASLVTVGIALDASLVVKESTYDTITSSEQLDESGSSGNDAHVNAKKIMVDKVASDFENADIGPSYDSD